MTWASARRAGSTVGLIERRRRQADEGGFALVFVLAAIALTSIVMVALLGLAMTSSRITVSQRDAAARQRAASGAIEAAIGQIALSDPALPCGGMPNGGADSGRLTFEAGTPGGGTDVEVDCWSQDLAPTLPAEDAIQPRMVSMSPPLEANGYRPFGAADVMSFDCLANAANCSRSFTTTWSSAGTEPLRSARLLFQSHEGENVHNLHRNLNVRVTLAGGGQCTVSVPGGRANLWAGVYTSVDLFGSQQCRDLFAGTTQAVFQGASIRVVHQYVAGSGCPLVGCAAALTVGESRILTNVQTIEGSTATGTGWNNVDAVRSIGTPATQVGQNDCTPTEERCRYAAAGDVFELTVSGFDPSTSSDLEPGDYVDELGVVIDSPLNSPVRSWISDPIDATWFEVELSIGGTPCGSADRRDGFARSNQQMYVDLLASSGCRAAVQTVDDLAGASVTYRVKVDCLHIGTTRAPVDGAGRCATVRLPNLDRVALAVTPVSLPREAIVTLSARVGTRLVAQADVFFDGAVAAPRPTPVVSWRYEDFTTPPPGPATP
jgi:type II secretory pathway pseudopilin PulG